MLFILAEFPSIRYIPASPVNGRCFSSNVSFDRVCTNLDPPEGNLIIIEFTVGNVLVSFLLLLVQWF